jgi:hypothetical protein
MQYFMGTQSHNTVMLGEFDQMQKGPRFVWLNWTQAVSAKVYQDAGEYVFEGIIQAFRHVDKNIIHQRIVRKIIGLPIWNISDFVDHKTALPIHQIWNVSNEFEATFSLEAFDEHGNRIIPVRKKGWYSNTYGDRSESLQIIYTSAGKKIFTRISEKQIN